MLRELTFTVDVIALFIQGITREIPLTDPTAKAAIVIDLNQRGVRETSVSRDYVMGGDLLLHGVDDRATGETAAVQTDRLFQEARHRCFSRELTNESLILIDAYAKASLEREREKGWLSFSICIG